MIVRFHENNNITVLKETSDDRLTIPSVGWNVAIDKTEYLVKNIRADYDNGIISINLKYITNLV